MDFSRHARSQITERKIERQWVVKTVSEPEFVREDANDQNVILAFRRIPEAGDRWLRVVYTARAEKVIVITAFFDRKARR